MESNVQKMREALREIQDLADALDIDEPNVVAILDVCRDALSLPLLNCNVGTAEDLIRRHESYCGNSVDSFACINGPGSECKKCFAKWLQKPYVEGGTE